MLSALDLGRPLRDRIADGGNPGCQGQISTRLRRSPIAPARSLLGHEERFPPTRLSAGCGFRKETIAGMRRNGRDAPKADAHNLVAVVQGQR
jgi:hypothetical protein